MTTTVINRQKAHRLNMRKIRVLFLLLMKRVERMTPGRKWGEISVVLTDDAGISRVNREHLHRVGPTDVISFRYDPLPWERTLCGEVVVNVQRALEAGPAHGGCSHELALYIAHGCDHLAGETDRTRRRCTRMRRRELRWLREAGTAQLVTGLFLRGTERTAGSSAHPVGRGRRGGHD